MDFYIQINEKNIVTGYSSHIVNENDILRTEEEINNTFIKAPIFYIYDKTSDTFSYSQELEDEFKNSINKSNVDILYEELMAAKLDIMDLKNTITELRGGN